VPDPSEASAQRAPVAETQAAEVQPADKKSRSHRNRK
jgi:hypothetical protein